MANIDVHARNWVIMGRQLEHMRQKKEAVDREIAEKRTERAQLEEDMVNQLSVENAPTRTLRIFLPKDELIEATLVEIMVNCSTPGACSDRIDVVAEAHK